MSEVKRISNNRLKMPISLFVVGDFVLGDVKGKKFNWGSSIVLARAFAGMHLKRCHYYK